MDDPNGQIADRRRQWAALTPAQRLRRIQQATGACVDYARWRRQQRRQLQTCFAMDEETDGYSE
jgi:hypothetical protein